MNTAPYAARNENEGGLPASLSVLGATGSVGRQALEVAAEHRIPLDLITANVDVSGMEALARAYHPRFCVMADEGAARDLALRLSDTPIAVRLDGGTLSIGLREDGHLLMTGPANTVFEGKVTL